MGQGSTSPCTQHPTALERRDQLGELSTGILDMGKRREIKLHGQTLHPGGPWSCQNHRDRESSEGQGLGQVQSFSVTG